MSLRCRLGVAAAGLALAASLAAPAAAAPKGADPNAPAFVNLNQVLAEFRKTGAFAKYQQKLADKAKEFNQEMETLTQLRYCSDVERKEALGLKVKNRSPKEQTRLDELMKKAEEVDKEHAALSQKEKPTETEAKRLQEITKMREDAVKSLDKEKADREDQMAKMQSDLMAEVEDELLKLVEKVAKDQKIVTIYERRAVLFGGNDLTPDVIKKLPK